MADEHRCSFNIYDQGFYMQYFTCFKNPSPQLISIVVVFVVGIPVFVCNIRTRSAAIKHARNENRVLFHEDTIPCLHPAPFVTNCSKFWEETVLFFGAPSGLLTFIQTWLDSISILWSSRTSCWAFEEARILIFPETGMSFDLNKLQKLLNIFTLCCFCSRGSESL